MRSADLSMIIGHDSKVLEANEAFCELISHPKKNVISRIFLDFIFPDDHKTAVNAFIDVFYGLRQPKKYSFRLVGAENEPIAITAIFTLKDIELTPSAHIQLALENEETSLNN
jgi:PAS domain-containing protein